MKRKTIYFLIAIVAATGWVMPGRAIDIEITPGGLQSILQSDKLNGARELSLAGEIDARDLEAIGKLPSGVVALNLAKSPVMRYSSRGEKLFGHNLLEANVIPEYCFFRSQFQKVILPEGTERIGEGAFAGSEIIDITIPEGVSNIGQYAFYDCRQLKSVRIPSTVEIIDKGAFSNCVSLETVVFEGNERLREIPENCFAGCARLEGVGLPVSVVRIGREAFRGSGIEVLDLTTVKELEPYSLSGMGALETVLLNKDAKVGEGVLMDNVSLTGISGTPEEIPSYFAANCIKLNASRSLDEAQAVGDYAFANSAAEMLVLGSGVMTLGEGVFHSMPNLSKIDALALDGRIPDVEESSFAGIDPSGIELYVTDDSYDSWKGDKLWGQFKVQRQTETEVQLTRFGTEGIEISLSGYLLTVKADDKIEELDIYTSDGRILNRLEGLGTYAEVELEAEKSSIVIVTVVTPGNRKSAKLILK